jgi:hypothetical protein
MPHNTLFIKIEQAPPTARELETKVGLLVRYDGQGMSGPVEFGTDQVLSTLDIDGIVITYPDGSQVAWPQGDPRWHLDE